MLESLRACRSSSATYSLSSPSGNSCVRQSELILLPCLCCPQGGRPHACWAQARLRFRAARCVVGHAHHPWLHAGNTHLRLIMHLWPIMYLRLIMSQLYCVFDQDPGDGAVALGLLYKLAHAAARQGARGSGPLMTMLLGVLPNGWVGLCAAQSRNTAGESSRVLHRPATSCALPAIGQSDGGMQCECHGTSQLRCIASLSA
jgi:hypothetical protein